MIGVEQKLGQAAEVVLERLLVEGNAGQAQKIVLEVVQVPGDGLAIEARARIADLVIRDRGPLQPESAAARRRLCDRLQRPAGAMVSPPRLVAEEFEERGVAEVFFEVGALAQILRVDLRHRQSVTAKMAGELKKGDVLFAHGVENADGAVAAAGEPDDDASRAAELALKRLHAFGRQMEMLLEEPF